MNFVADTLAVGTVANLTILTHAVTTGRVNVVRVRAPKTTAETADNPPAAVSAVPTRTLGDQPDMSREDAAKALGVSVRTVRRMGHPKRGELDEVPPVLGTRVTTESVRRCLDGQAAKP